MRAFKGVYYFFIRYNKGFECAVLVRFNNFREWVIWIIRKQIDVIIFN